jgi:hypothetical protein
MVGKDQRVRAQGGLPDVLGLAALARAVILRRTEHVVGRLIGDLVDLQALFGIDDVAVGDLPDQQGELVAGSGQGDRAEDVRVVHACPPHHPRDARGGFELGALEH